MPCRQWRPLCWISHMLDCQFYGRNAGGHHLTNVILHAATAVPVFARPPADDRPRVPRALAAVLFAVHPLRVESVAWIAERKDVLSGLLFMLTLGAYVSDVASGEKGRAEICARRSLSARVFPQGLLRPRWPAALQPSLPRGHRLFRDGLMSKPMLVTLPFLLVAGLLAPGPSARFWESLPRESPAVWRWQPSLA